MLPIDSEVRINDAFIQAFDQFVQSINSVKSVSLFFPVNQDCIIWDIVDIRLVNVISTNVLVIALNMQNKNLII
jgi:hypothetical protein